MKKGLTEIIFILDRSGSMGGLESDVIGGFNSMLKTQQSKEGNAIVTTVLFDDRYELLHDRIPLKGVQPLTKEEYYVRGSTALLDAVGMTIDKISNAHQHTAADECAEKTLVIINTDGLENASRHYSTDRIREMIARQKEAFGWDFIFLGANMDAVETAKHMGIDSAHAVTAMSDKESMPLQFEAMSDAVTSARFDEKFNNDWKKSVEADTVKRGFKRTPSR